MCGLGVCRLRVCCLGVCCLGVGCLCACCLCVLSRCVLSLCVCVVSGAEAEAGGGGVRHRKEEPGTKMWGKTTIV